jgi:hypothetical protein
MNYQNLNLNNEEETTILKSLLNECGNHYKQLHRGMIMYSQMKPSKLRDILLQQLDLGCERLFVTSNAIKPQFENIIETEANDEVRSKLAEKHAIWRDEYNKYVGRQINFKNATSGCLHMVQKAQQDYLVREQQIDKLIHFIQTHKFEEKIYQPTISKPLFEQKQLQDCNDEFNLGQQKGLEKISEDLFLWMKYFELVYQQSSKIQNSIDDQSAKFRQLCSNLHKEISKQFPDYEDHTTYWLLVLIRRFAKTTQNFTPETRQSLFIRSFQVMRINEFLEAQQVQVNLDQKILGANREFFLDLISMHSELALIDRIKQDTQFFISPTVHNLKTYAENLKKMRINLQNEYQRSAISEENLWKNPKDVMAMWLYKMCLLDHSMTITSWSQFLQWLQNNQVTLPVVKATDKIVKKLTHRLKILVGFAHLRLDQQIQQTLDNIGKTQIFLFDELVDPTVLSQIDSLRAYCGQSDAKTCLDNLRAQLTEDFEKMIKLPEIKYRE